MLTEREGTMAARRVWMVLAVLAASTSVLVAAPPAGAVVPPVVTGHATTSSGVSLDTVVVEACPSGTAHVFFSPCAGGVLTTASVFNGYYRLQLPSAGDWDIKAAGAFCGSFFVSPSSVGTIAADTTTELTIDTSSLVEPSTSDLAPPFADEADPAGETDLSDGRLHLALRDVDRRILVGGFPGGPCVRLHVPYRPLQVLVMVPQDRGPGPFPLLVLSHGGGETAVNPGRVSGAQQYVDKGYAVAIPTYPLTARYGSWPGSYLRDIDDQAKDLAFILEDLTRRSFVDADRIGLAGVSAGGMTSLLAAFHETGFVGGIRAVAPTIARPLTAPEELDVPLRTGDIPLLMSNNVDDTVNPFPAAGAFWQGATAPKYRWLEDTPAVVPENDHGFTPSMEPSALVGLFFDAYVMGDAAARAQLDTTADPAGPEYTFEAVPGVEGFTGPLAVPVVAKQGRAVPIELQLWAKVGTLQATITGPSGALPPKPLAFRRVAGTYQAVWTTKGLATGTYTVSIDTGGFGTFSQTVTLR
ncbi:MAG: alpha/beta hydrolase family protein [Acidimicrobiales bacterium]